jgi:hypothetical protein
MYSVQGIETFFARWRAGVDCHILRATLDEGADSSDSRQSDE